MNFSSIVCLYMLGSIIDALSIGYAYSRGVLGPAVFTHLSYFVLLSIASFSYNRRYHEGILPALSLFLSFVFPVIGPISAVVFLVQLKGSQNKSLLDEADQSESLLLDTITDLKTAELTDRKNQLTQQIETEINVQSFIEILKHQSLHQQRSVIGILQRSRAPANIQLLQFAQSHKAPEIIQMASAALSEMEADWFEEIKQIEDQIATDPSNLSLRFEVLRQYLMLHESQLIVTGVAPFYMVNALEHVRATTPLALKNHGVLQMIGQVLLVAGNAELALKIFTRALEIAPDQDSLRLWVAEAHYKMRNFHLAKQELAQISPGNSNARIQEVVKAWN